MIVYSILSCSKCAKPSKKNEQNRYAYLLGSLRKKIRPVRAVFRFGRAFVSLARITLGALRDDDFLNRWSPVLGFIKNLFARGIFWFWLFFAADLLNSSLAHPNSQKLSMKLIFSRSVRSTILQLLISQALPAFLSDFLVCPPFLILHFQLPIILFHFIFFFTVFFLFSLLCSSTDFPRPSVPIPPRSPSPGSSPSPLSAFFSDFGTH